MALQYPLLFPNGEDGYHNKIHFQSANPNSEKERDMISMKDYNSYRYCPRTVFDKSGFPVYKCRRQNITIKKGNEELDNQWVVPYNRDLLITGRKRHINVEANDHPIDEINAYFDGRYKVVEREKERMSKLEAFFALNVADIEANQYTYEEIPQHYVWDDAEAFK
ncbi:hypothetical protein AgCh_013178 [Apium graveolens]